MEHDPASDRRSRFTLRQLEAFCMVSTTGSVSGAARRLHRTQSAVSAAVSELEASLGTALFERVGRGLRATDAARRLLPRALDLVERAAELPALAVDAVGEPERIQVGASRTIGPFVMPGLLARFARQRPQASVDLSVANTAALLARLRRHELEVAFVEGDVAAPGLSLVEWMPDALCLFARADHPLALRFARPGQRPGTPARDYAAALAGAAWALREPGSGTLETFLRAVAPAIGAPRIGITVDEPLSLQRLVEGGDWLGCMSRRAVQDAFDAGRLVELPAPGREVRQALVRRFWIVRLPDRYRTTAVDALLALALAEAGVAGAATTRRPAAPRSGPDRRSRR
jgi:DNA-binding transcriptional LysR family regulator